MICVSKNGWVTDLPPGDEPPAFQPYREEEDHDQFLLFVIYETNPPEDVQDWVMEG